MCVVIRHNSSKRAVQEREREMGDVPFVVVVVEEKELRVRVLVACLFQTTGL